MFTSVIKVAYRSLLRNKVNSSINIVGLTVGITCGIFVFLIISQELSFDKFHLKADRIYRVHTKIKEGEGYAASAPLQTAEALAQEFPEIEAATTIVTGNNAVIKVDQQLFKEQNLAYAAPEYFSILDAHWLVGDPRSSLSARILL